MDLSQYYQKNTVNSMVISDIPVICKSEECCLGIDEAGRGPVLGPMVYGCCYCPKSYKDTLKESGYVDSKTLSEDERESLFSKISSAHQNIGWMIHILSPTIISNNMLGRCKYNLNQLSHDTAIGLIRKALDTGVNVKEVFVDTVGIAEKYQSKLEEIFPGIEITVTSKADALFPVVSAASICAKVARDRMVKNWVFPEGIHVTEDVPYGSGYPSDPDTKKWLKSQCDPVFGFPQFVRFSWSTAQAVIDDQGAAVQWEDDNEETAKKSKADLKREEAAKGTKSITSFFSASSKSNINKTKVVRKNTRKCFLENANITTVNAFM